MATRCFSPPLKRRPRSPTAVSHPLGIACMRARGYIHVAYTRVTRGYTSIHVDTGWHVDSEGEVSHGLRRRLYRRQQLRELRRALGVRECARRVTVTHVLLDATVEEDGVLRGGGLVIPPHQPPRQQRHDKETTAPTGHAHTTRKNNNNNNDHNNNNNASTLHTCGTTPIARRSDRCVTRETSCPSTSTTPAPTS